MAKIRLDCQKSSTWALILLLPLQSRRCCHSCIEKRHDRHSLCTMMNEIGRRKRPMRWSRVALMGFVLLSDVRQATARTWEVLVEPSTYILIDREMIRQIPESDPFFTQTQLGTDAPTQMPVPTPSPVPQPTSAPSVSPSLRPTRTQSPTVTPVPTSPTFSPHPTEYVSYPPGQEPTAAPTPIYRNSDPNSLCKNGEKLHEIHMQDTFGDGWEGRNLTIIVADSPHVLSKVTETQVGNSTEIKYKVTLLNGTDVWYDPGTRIYTGTLYGGAIGIDYACIRPGVCYEAHMPGGAWAEEILWEIKVPTVNVTPVENAGGLVIAKGGAPASCQFSIPDEVTGMTYCPTNCNRFPLDPTPFPSASPTGSSMPSNVPSSNFPSEMPSLFPSLEPSELPSLYPSMLPSEEPTESPSAAPTPPPVAPVVVSQRLPIGNTPTIGSTTPPTTAAPITVAPVPAPTSRQPTPPSNGGTINRPLPTLNTPPTQSPTTFVPPTVPQPTFRWQRRQPTISPNGGSPPTGQPTNPSPAPTAAPPTRQPSTLAPVSLPTLSSAGPEPTPQVSNRNPYNRPWATGGGGNRQPTNQATNYRHPWNTKTSPQPTQTNPTQAPAVKETLDISGNTSTQPTPAPAVKETLDISDVGNGVR